MSAPEALPKLLEVLELLHTSKDEQTTAALARAFGLPAPKPLLVGNPY